MPIINKARIIVISAVVERSSDVDIIERENGVGSICFLTFLYRVQDELWRPEELGLRDILDMEDKQVLLQIKRDGSCIREIQLDHQHIIFVRGHVPCKV